MPQNNLLPELLTFLLFMLQKGRLMSVCYRLQHVRYQHIVPELPAPPVVIASGRR